jgi:hypothetical protein
MCWAKLQVTTQRINSPLNNTTSKRYIPQEMTAAWANVFKRTKSLTNHPSHVICVYSWELCIGTAGNTKEEDG